MSKRFVKLIALLLLLHDEQTLCKTHCLSSARWTNALYNSLPFFCTMSKRFVRLSHLLHDEQTLCKTHCPSSARWANALYTSLPFFCTMNKRFVYFIALLLHDEQTLFTTHCLMIVCIHIQTHTHTHTWIGSQRRYYGCWCSTQTIIDHTYSLNTLKHTRLSWVAVRNYGCWSSTQTIIDHTYSLNTFKHTHLTWIAAELVRLLEQHPNDHQSYILTKHIQTHTPELDHSWDITAAGAAPKRSSIIHTH